MENGDARDNSIEWVYNSGNATGSFYTKRFVNRMKRLAAKYPDEVEIIENKDGSICCHFPLNYVKITRPAQRELSEEQRIKAAERFAKYRKEKKSGAL